MGRSSKSKSKTPRKPMDPETKRRLQRAFLAFSLTLLVVVSAAAGVQYAQRWVDRKAARPSSPPQVVLKDVPAWMSDSLADQIVAEIKPTSASSAFDHQLLEDTANKLKRNPWVRQVLQVRRVFEQQPGDTLEIDCEYRAPIALVNWQDTFWLVDDEGFLLPEQYTAQQVPRIVLGPDHRQMNLRLIEGVEHAPPAPGSKWPGDDLAAAIDLAKLMCGRDYVNDVFKIRVANFDGRRDPRESQIVFITRYGTEVRWGRPIGAKDFFAEVAPSQKLESLRQIFEQFGRIDARRAWIDIRYDRVTYPKAEPESAQATGRRDIDGNAVQ
jgi:hypothetical protein